MPSLQRIESQIVSLPEPQLRQFRNWFNEFDAGNWDLSLETDINVGKLDPLAAEALAQYSAGQCRCQKLEVEAMARSLMSMR